MTDTYSLTDISDHIELLLEMMKSHEEHLYGIIDMVGEVQDEILHLISQDTDDD